MNTKITDEQVLARAVTLFNEEFPPKFIAGGKKYTSPITDKDCIAEAKQECYDLWAYLTAEEMRRERAHKLAQGLRNSADNHSASEWDSLISLLEPKKLAVKQKEKTPSSEGASAQASFNL
jgi:hypothetical protein